MKPSPALVATSFLVLLVLWAALTAATAPAPAATPDAASERAVHALSEEPPGSAAGRIPEAFSEDLGYAPRLEDGTLVNPTGACSSPVPLPREFETACRSHDLGYDLLRHAELRGGTLPPQARQVLDRRFSEDTHRACDARDTTSSRTSCRVWADIATGAVRLNSWRQHDLVPGPENPASIATGTVGVLALGSGGGGLAMAMAAVRRRLAAARLPFALPTAPRVSTCVAGVTGLFLSISPASLPHGWLLQGAVTAFFVGVALGASALLRPAVPRLTGRGHRLGVGVAAAAGIAVLVWAQLALGARRSELDLVAPGLGYWAGVAAVVAGCALLLRGLTRLWAARRRLWRPVLAMTTATLVVTATGPVHASDTTPDEALLLGSSSVGAVRAYGEISEDEGPAARADRVVDELVREGGLSRSRIVIAVPTGSGWVNPNLVRGLEQRFGSDVATVSMQYDSSPSWVAYLFGRDRAEQGAEALVDAVVDRVEELPEEQRPEVHVQGESLGATAGQAALSGPTGSRGICSALWVGAPGGHDVGMPREVSVANADDPVVHASARDLVLPPGGDGPWLPGVSAVHSAADFLGSLEVPNGSGHRYGTEPAHRLQTCG